MQNNYYFLRQLSLHLKSKLTGWIFGTCFSQEKNELVLGFWKAAKNEDAEKGYEGAEFYIKAVLQPDFATLVFQNEFHRAKRNSVDLYSELVGAAVTDVVQYENERAFSIVFEHGFLLLFKMYGNRSNVLLFQNGEFLEMFNHKLKPDQLIKPEKLNRKLQPTFADFEDTNFDLQKTYPTFGKILHQHIESQRFVSENEKWDFIQKIISELQNPVFYVSLFRDNPSLLLLPLGNIQFQTMDPIEAANQFYILYSKTHFFGKEKQQIIKQLEKRKTQSESYLLKNYDKLNELESGSRNEEIANILMANLHQIPENVETVELFDFYHDKNSIIKLKKSLTPQRNAEIYYRKSKNEKIEIEKLRESIHSKENELQRVENQMDEISKIENIKDFKNYLKENKIIGEKSAVESESIDELFKKFSFLGFDIYVGRNAKNNDLLTQKFAFKEDLWLHAKDVSGSHVIIKYQSGKTFPEPVIEKAASLAAFYSKRKNDSLCPVIVTPKKFVRKTKGLAEGKVIVEKEKIIMVEPKEF